MPRRKIATPPAHERRAMSAALVACSEAIGAAFWLALFSAAVAAFA